jgi:ABC-type multidrug transport system fused ATPase/permease subunit
MNFLQVVLGGTVAYTPQTAWIRNATVRENILFGQPDDEEKFREIIRACNLEHDLEMLPNGEQTEIGEKGINLSGTRKSVLENAHFLTCSAIQVAKKSGLILVIVLLNMTDDLYA